VHDVKILIVEDEGIEALDIQHRLISLGYPTPDIAFSGEEAVQKAGEISPDLVLMDIMLPGEIDGITAAELIKACLDIPVIYLTAYADDNTLQRAKITEPNGYIIKPFRERELHITIDMALYKHQIEKKLKESEKWLATTLRSIGDAVITTDQNGLVTFMNPVAEVLTGWQLEEGRYKKLTEVFNIINMYTRKPAENPVKKVLQEGFTVGLANHTILINRNGAEIPIDDSAAPIKDSRENIIGVVLVFRDVTERKEAEEALRRSEERYRELAEKLRVADERKNEFLAVLSHELRNPLTSIRNSLFILDQAEPGGEQARRAKGILERQVGQLSRLVDDLLDITRITRNKIRLQRERIELNELVRQTIEDHRALFEASGVQLETEFAPAALFLQADRVRLVQVVGNLLQNSAKFTGHGGKTRVSIESDTAKQRAIIRVADTGVGMAPEQVSRLFQPFMQAEITIDRSRGGLGLGLALSKGLVELHGGEISASSAGLGKGSEFVVSLPLDSISGAELQDVPAEGPRRSRRVLIIDDYTDIAESLRELLELNNHKVAVAYNGPDGIAKAREFRPEILLCDIGLPRMNGYEVAVAFRRDEELSNVYLVAMTGYALQEDLQKAADAGFDCHLAKPVDIDKLNSILAHLPEVASRTKRQQERLHTNRYDPCRSQIWMKMSLLGSAKIM
jgi:PAS domain S-box-containing protein